MAKLDYNGFKKAILKDFENQTAGLEVELQKLINQKFSDIKLNPTKLRQAIKDAMTVATRDLKSDVVDKIDLSQFIDSDPETLKEALKGQKNVIEKTIKELNNAIKDGVGGKALSDLQDKAKIEAEQYIGAFRTAIQKGLKLDTSELDKSSLTSLQNQLTDMGVIAKETVDKVNGYLSQIGVNVQSERILDKVKNQLSSEDYFKLLDSAGMKRGAAMAQQSFDAIAEGVKVAKGAIDELGSAYDTAAEQLQNFAGAQEQLSDSFRNVEGVKQMADAMGEYAEKVGAASKLRQETESGTNIGVEAEKRKAQAAEHTAAEEEKVNDLLRQGNELRQKITESTEFDASKIKPLEDAISTINNLLDAIIRKFGVEGQTATTFSDKGQENLEQLRQALEKIDTALQNIGEKKISINLSSLKGLNKDQLENVLDVLNDKLNTINNKTISINIKDIKTVSDANFIQNIQTLGTYLNALPDKKININVSSLKEIEDLDGKLKAISIYLGNISDKQINVSINGLKELSGLGSQDISGVIDSIKNLPDKRVNIDIAGVNAIADPNVKANIDTLSTELQKISDKKINFNFSSLKNIEDLEGKLASIEKHLGQMTNKKISINIVGLKDLSTQDIETKLVKLKEVLETFPENLKGIDIKGLSSLNELLKLDVNPEVLGGKFDKLAKAIGDFAEALAKIPSVDTGFLTSIDNLLKHGDQLANLATLVKAKQSDIDKVQKNISGSSQVDVSKLNTIKQITAALEKEEKQIEQLSQAYHKAGDNDSLIAISTAMQESADRAAELSNKLDEIRNKEATDKTLPKSSDYSNALKYAKEYWTIKLKGNEATEEELTKLKVIEAEWDLLNSKVGDVTAKLEAQGKSIKSVSEFAAMYTNNATSGLQQYIRQETGIGDPYKYLSESIIPNTTKYTSDVIKEATRLQGIFEKANIKHLIDQGAFKEINDAIASLKALKTEASSMEGKLVKSIKITGLIDEISKYKNTFSGLSRDTVGELDKYIRQLQDGLKNGMSVAKFNEVANAINGIKTKAREAGEETKSFWTRLGEQVQHTNEKMIGMYLSFYRIIGYIRQATSAVIELDSALTELRKITDISVERLNQSFQTSAETAKAMGSTIDAVISQTSDWSRLLKKGLLCSNT